jgi:hypothetical protein
MKLPHQRKKNDNAFFFFFLFSLMVYSTVLIMLKTFTILGQQFNAAIVTCVFETLSRQFSFRAPGRSPLKKVTILANSEY